MAAIDKLYGTNKQYHQLRGFLHIEKPEYKKYMYPEPPPVDDMAHAISCFPEFVDAWLLDNCNISWVKEQILDQYMPNKPQYN